MKTFPAFWLLLIGGAIPLAAKEPPPITVHQADSRELPTVVFPGGKRVPLTDEFTSYAGRFEISPEGRWIVQI